MRKMLPIILLVFLVIAHYFSLGKVTEQAKALPRGEEVAYVLPVPVLKITALEFHGIASDFLFLRSLVFLGSTLERQGEHPVKAWEWKWLYHVLDASTGLDPYFFDPYYFGNANLTWDGGLVVEANTLLARGVRNRSWDFLLPFFKGFNEFYFLGENAQASESLMEASRRPGASPLYASLAARLAYKERRMENAIAFQEYILEHTEDPSQRKEHEDRLKVLRGLNSLEKATAKYKGKFGRYPRKIDELIAKKIIPELPAEPYGGTYYINSQGQVKTTSEAKLMPYQRLNLLPSSPSMLPPGQSVL